MRLSADQGNQERGPQCPSKRNRGLVSDISGSFECARFFVSCDCLGIFALTVSVICCENFVKCLLAKSQHEKKTVGIFFNIEK